ncbi:YbaK/EbsC family protein [Tepidiforma sp.]|uniref:YbaK/EbsC family protein n=1 Tax=Tepidiforma sp. TaxID=2682230 RepID=UPI002ADE14B8|nr:YbaK/EbsC family protein [Tepidiforma sp.]
MSGPKPLAIRRLEAEGIAFRVHRFDASIRSAVEVAGALGIEPVRVLKTLVIEENPPRGRPYLLMVPAALTIDLKALARELGAKRLRMAAHLEAERITGLRVGGISALTLAGRGFRILIDRSVTDHDQVLVSAGERGIDVELRPADLITVTGAVPVTVVGLAEPTH